MRDVYIVGVYTNKFGRLLDRGVKDLAAESALGALKDASLDQTDLQSVWFSNSGWGFSQFQHCIRGQVALRAVGIDGLPITNVENACASGSTAFHGAWKDVASGLYDVSLAIGAEKIHQPNKYAVFAGFIAGTDVEIVGAEVERLQANSFQANTAELALASGDAVRVASPVKARARPPRTLRGRLLDLRDQAVVGIQLGETIGYDTVRTIVGVQRGGKGRKGKGGEHSPFMDVYAFKAREHMQKYGSTAHQLAAIASKNHWHSSLNPNAQYTFEVSVEQVLADRMVALPLTRSMCAPIGDGTAAAIVMSEAAARRHGLMSRAVRVRASVLGSGRSRAPDEPDIGERLAKLAYARAELSPSDVDLVELHDATAFGELTQSESLGFFEKGTGGLHAERGDTKLGGKLPINPSGGLLSRGHPIGASGLAQLHELVTQLRQEAGPRQVQNARIALAENGGGALGEEEAAMCIHILERPSNS
ncbi:MAG: Thiolase family protein [Myxococcaceae bacterium]|nr:Thiolase family protein [Myxococcaceae bacterium]